MINYCPEGTTNANVIEKCQEDTTGYLQAIPVHSQDTDLVYSNIFCALCHNDVNLTKTKGTVHCNNEDLLKNCGISPFDHILLPEYHLQNTLTWTRLLGKLQIAPVNVDRNILLSTHATSFRTIWQGPTKQLFRIAKLLLILPTQS